jgi:hypothetical protein
MERNMSICSTGLSREEKAAVVRGVDGQRLEPITITVAQAKQISNLGHTTIYKMFAAKQIQSVKHGSRLLVVYESLKKRLLGSDEEEGK